MMLVAGIGMLLVLGYAEVEKPIAGVSQEPACVIINLSLLPQLFRYQHLLVVACSTSQTPVSSDTNTFIP